MSRELGICGEIIILGDASPKLAPELSWPSVGGTVGNVQTVTVDVQGSLQTALLATGKFGFYYLRISGTTAETTTVKLTIDGEVIWNDTFTSGTWILLYNNNAPQLPNIEGMRLVEETFLLEMQTATDTSIVVNYILRPIA